MKEEIKLDVPLIRQPKNSVECAIAGITMILKYYGFDIKQEDIKSDLGVEVNVPGVGNYIPQMGSYLIKNGFRVNIVSMNPHIFTKQNKEKNTKELIKYFEDFSRNTSSDENKKISVYFIDFLRIGGAIDIKIPSIEDIIYELNEKRPVGASLTTNFMNSYKIGFNSHFNVITGIDDRFIYVNDPMWNKMGGKRRYPIKDFFFGLYSNSRVIDDGCLIKIIKK